MVKKIFILIWLPFLFAASPSKDPQQVLREVQREIIDLDRQFELLRKDLFFPKDSEVLFYVRNGVKEELPIEKISLYLNGKKLHEHIYTDNEVIAFNFSTLQPLHRLSLKPGNYRLEVRCDLAKSKGPQQVHQFVLRKQQEPQFVEIILAEERRPKRMTIREKIW